MRLALRPSVSHGKLESFEGIRGLASFGVFISHLIIGFWPVLYGRGHPLVAEFPRPVRWVAETPARVLYDGQFAVSLFFILSGFVLSLAYFRKPSSEALASAAARRYPRLMIPAAASVLIAFVFMKLGWMYNLEADRVMNETFGYGRQWLSYFYDFSPSAREAAREAVWDTFFIDRTRYNANLWTMAVELPGSFVVYGFVALFGALRYRIVFYLAATAVLLLSSKPFTLDFLIGIMIADLYAANERARRPFRLPGVIALGLAAASLYVVFKKPDSGEYTLWGMASIKKAHIYEMAGGVLLIGSTAFSRTLQWLFERRVCAFLGKISFSLYLLHLILICSVASVVYVRLRAAGLGHDWAAGIGSLACIAASVAASWAMYLLVDKPTITACRWVYDRCFRPRPVVTDRTELPVLTLSPAVVPAKAA